MELTNDFRVALPVDQAWAVLTDLERIAPCMPGAQLQEIEGDEHRGIVKIKVGPITAQYKGQATFLQRDDATHVAVLRAEGRETRGQGSANATITAALVADGDGTAVSVITDLTVTGRVAQFGRGVLADVSAKLLDQFVASLEKMVLADDSAGAAPVSAAADAPAAAATDTTSPRSDAPEAGAASTTAPASVASEAAAAEPATADAPTTSAPAKPVAPTPAATKKAPAASKPAAAKKAPAAKKPAVVAARTAPKAPGAVSAAVTAAAPAPDAAPVSGTAGSAPVATPAAAASPAIRRIDSPEPEAVNLLDAAGSPVAKRVGPILAAVAVLWLLKKLFSRRKR